MLFMVIERFLGGDPRPAGERFRREGRMLPEGVIYINSWLDTAGGRCFQVMEAPNRSSLDGWIARWSDLVDFEVIPVQTSAEYWSSVRSHAANPCPPGSCRA